MDILTKPEALALAEREIRAVDGCGLDPSAVKKDGSTLNVLIGGAVYGVAELVQQRVFGALSDRRRSSAQDDKLDALVYEQTFGRVLRKGANAASVTVSFQRSATDASPAGIVPRGTVLVAGAQRFTTDRDVHFGRGEAGPTTVDATATATGAETNVAAAAIKGLEGEVFDPKLTVTNVRAASGGSPRETNSQFRARADRFRLSGGQLTSLEDAAMAVGGIAQALAIELPAPNGRFITTLYVGDADGQCSDSLVRSVVQAIDDVRCGGDPVSVVGVVPTLVRIVLRPSYLAGYATEATRSAVQNRVVSEVAGLTPNERLRRALLVSAMESVTGVVVDDDSVIEPAGDLVPAAGGVFRTHAGLVTVL